MTDRINSDDESEDEEEVVFGMEQDDKPLLSKQASQQSTGSYWKWTKTGALVCVWINLGVFMEIAGPTLKDLVFRIGADYEAVSGAMSGRSVGEFLGSIVGGFLVDTFGSLCDLFVALPLTIGAVTTLILPWAYSTDLLWFLYFVLGIVLSTINIVGQRVILATWLAKAASPLHILHLGYGVGGFIAPLIANPFLADKKTVSSFNVLTNNASTAPTRSVSVTHVLTNLSTETTTMSKSRIEYAYGIVSAMTICVAIMFYFFQCHACLLYKKTVTNNPLEEDVLEKKKSLKEMLNPASCASGNLSFGLTVLLAMFCKYFIFTGQDRITGTFIRSYSVDYLQVSNDDGSYINTIFWVFYSVGRFVAFVATRWVSVKIVLLVESFFNLAVCICMVLFALHNVTAMWVLTACLGFVIGPMFPTGIAWGNHHIKLTGLAITWVMLGSAAGGLVFLRIAGFVYDYYGPSSFIYMLLGFSIVLLVLDLILTFISILHSYSSETTYKLDTYELDKVE